MPKNKNKIKKIKASKIVIQKSKSKRRTRRRRMKRVNIPAAQGTRIPKPRFRRVMSKYNEQEIIIEGEDLVIPTPDALPTESTTSPVFLSIPANPLYWKGTRISGIASVYQQYRPLYFEVDYIPQVPVTVPGQVIYGTLYNKGVSKDSFQQTLMTSNGGGMTQCYLKSTSRVICNKKTLPLTLYNTFDPMNENVANPFTWVAHYSGAWSGTSGTPTTSQPGWVYVRWKYLFSVGLGNNGRQVEVLNQTSSELAQLTNAFAGWGIVISWLKNKAVTLLTKIAVVLLDETISTASAARDSLQTRLGVGSTFSVDPRSLRTDANDGTVELHDDAGNSFFIPDSTRVVVYENGDPYKDSERILSSYQLGFKIYKAVLNAPDASTYTGPLPTTNYQMLDSTATYSVASPEALRVVFENEAFNIVVLVAYHNDETAEENIILTSLQLETRTTGADTRYNYLLAVSIGDLNIYEFPIPYPGRHLNDAYSQVIIQNTEEDFDLGIIDCTQVVVDRDYTGGNTNFPPTIASYNFPC